MNPNITPDWYKKNLLNGIDLATPIYKFMPLKYVLPMIQNQKLAINRINEWEDVYENFILKQNYTLSDGTPIDVINQANGVFGQCWTICPETDAMWRIYSPEPNYNAIRIKTTVEKLYDALYQSDNNMADTYIGLVLYKAQKDIETAVLSLSPLDVRDFLSVVVDGAFVKRTEFSHEQEVRIVRILDSEQSTKAGELLYFPINSQFIEELCIDPRANDQITQQLTNDLINAGASQNIITKSSLYQFNANSIVFD